MDYVLWVFVDGGYIYASNGFNGFFRFNLDGSGRTLAARVPCEFRLEDTSRGGASWLMDGKLYILTTTQRPTGELNPPVVSVQVLLEVDYKNGTVREVWEQEMRDWLPERFGGSPQLNNSVFVMGGLGGKFYMQETIMVESTMAFFNSDTGLYEDEPFPDTQSTTLFSVNTADGNIEVIREYTPECGLAHGIDIVELAGGNPGLFYLSRSDGAFFQLDLSTGESTLVADGFTGDEWHMGRVRHGRLIAVNLEDWQYEQHAIDLATGEVTKLTLPHVRWEVGGYFYMVTDTTLELDPEGSMSVSQEEPQELIARIPAEDYFANNEDAVEELGWFTWDEVRERWGGL